MPVLFVIMLSHAPMAIATNSKDVVTLFSHGGSQFANIDSERNLTGPAIDAFKCTLTAMNHPYKIEYAPLSRARSLIIEANNSIWFPSVISKDTAKHRLPRMAPPIGTDTVTWFSLKTSNLDIASDHAKKTAKVATFQNSIFYKRLKNRGYQHVEQISNDRRMVSMLLQGEIDAFFSLSYKGDLSPATQKIVAERIKEGPGEPVSITFVVGRMLGAKDPAFVKNFHTNMKQCIP